MTREESLSAFRSQLNVLVEIARELGVHRDSPGVPSDALSFAESLLLCPTRHSAIEQMRQHPGPAQSFLEIAAFVETQLTSVPTSDAMKRLTITTPFYVVGAAVQEYLLSLKKHVGSQWK